MLRFCFENFSIASMNLLFYAEWVEWKTFNNFNKVRMKIHLKKAATIPLKNVIISQQMSE